MRGLRDPQEGGEIKYVCSSDPSHRGFRRKVVLYQWRLINDEGVDLDEVLDEEDQPSGDYMPTCAECFEPAREIQCDACAKELKGLSTTPKEHSCK